MAPVPLKVRDSGTQRDSERDGRKRLQPFTLRNTVPLSRWNGVHIPLKRVLTRSSGSTGETMMPDPLPSRF